MKEREREREREREKGWRILPVGRLAVPQHRIQISSMEFEWMARGRLFIDFSLPAARPRRLFTPIHANRRSPCLVLCQSVLLTFSLRQRTLTRAARGIRTKNDEIFLRNYTWKHNRNAESHYVLSQCYLFVFRIVTVSAPKLKIEQ